MLARVERAGQQRRLRSLKDLDAAAPLLMEFLAMCRIIVFFDSQ